MSPVNPFAGLPKPGGFICPCGARAVALELEDKTLSWCENAHIRFWHAGTDKLLYTVPATPLESPGSHDLVGYTSAGSPVWEYKRQAG